MTTSDLPDAPQRVVPPGLRARGKRLWSSIADAWDLDDHDADLLLEASRTVDLLDRLEDVIRSDGAIVNSPQGPKANPAAVEARQQRIALARILAAMRMPIGDDGEQADRRPQRRTGVRSPYKP